MGFLSLAPTPAAPAHGNPALLAPGLTAGRSIGLAAGFTLIELIVILLILTVVIGLVGLNLTRDASDQLKDETQRLALVLQAAEEEAILNGRVFVLTLARDGYQVLTPNDKGKLDKIADDALYQPYRLPDGMVISAASVEGIPAEQGRAEILIDPSGLLPAFTVDFRAGELRWRLEGLANGTTRNERLS
jgi:general secretion pathway protein H